MEWCKLYEQSNQPALEDISSYINNELWEELNSLLQTSYRVQPRLSYSQCSAQPGWNINYRKSGKSLCTLYPMEGFFIALIVIGDKETKEVEQTISSYTAYTQGLYKNTKFSCGGRWLMISVTKPTILDDVVNLIQIRVNTK